jgi:hypothetical protein
MQPASPANTLSRWAAQWSCDIPSRWVSAAAMAVFGAEFLDCLCFPIGVHNILSKLVNSPLDARYVVFNSHAVQYAKSVTCNHRATLPLRTVTSITPPLLP